VLGGQRDRVLPVGGLGDHLDVVFRLEQRPDAAADKRPAARARATRLSSWLRPLPSPSSSLRSTPSVARSSRTASAPASWIASSAGGTSSPRLRARCTATPAWTWITEMLCVRESCSSRAMRRRSSIALRRAASSLVRSASSARCSTSRTCSCHMRNVTTMTPAEMSHPAA